MRAVSPACCSRYRGAAAFIGIDQLRRSIADPPAVPGYNRRTSAAGGASSAA
jgi:hypothetical protein